MKNLFFGCFSVLDDEAREMVAFLVLPEPFHGVEVRAVRRETDRLDVMPVQALACVPTRVFDNQEDAPLVGFGDFDGHGDEERLKDFRVAVQYFTSHRHRRRQIAGNHPLRFPRFFVW